jgi:hypothetical protein
MAHTCPDCGCTCHCHGDIDDIILDNDEDISCCTHCSGTDADFNEAGTNYYGEDF